MLLFCKKEALSSFLAGILLPGIGLYDHRVPVDPDAAPWRMIGRVQTELGGRCTGFLIGPRLAITAAHCLYLRRPRHFIQPASVHFVTGYTRGSFDGHARLTAFRIAPGYDPENEARTAGADWAVLTLDTPIDTRDRLLPLAAAIPPDGTPVALAGYGRDRAELMDADPSCVLLGRGEDLDHRPLLHHSCDGTYGTSGAPLLARAANGRWQIIGIQCEASIAAAGGVAVPLTGADTMSR